MANSVHEQGMQALCVHHRLHVQGSHPLRHLLHPDKGPKVKNQFQLHQGRDPRNTAAAEPYGNKIQSQSLKARKPE